MKELSKNNRIANRIISMIMGILVGVVLIILGTVIKVETMVWIALVVWGVIIIIGNIPGLIYSIANINQKGSIFDLICSGLGILLGVGLIISQSQVVTVILAVYMIAFPVIRIILAKDSWTEQLKREALRIILGVVLLVFGGTLLGVGAKIINLLLKIIGWVVVGLSVVFAAIEIVRIATSKEHTKVDEPIYVEHDEV